MNVCIVDVIGCMVAAIWGPSKISSWCFADNERKRNYFEPLRDFLFLLVHVVYSDDSMRFLMTRMTSSIKEERLYTCYT